MSKDRWEYSEANPEYRAYIHSKEWKAKREERLSLDERTCPVCGKEATEVHHLTYVRFKNEDINDLVSLCHKCHQKAEDIYNPQITPWASNEKHISENGEHEDTNFMAAMRVDAKRITPIVLDYIKEVRGVSLQALMDLRKPLADGSKQYWGALRRIVFALCKKRYSLECREGEDRQDLLMRTVSNEAIVCALVQIEHDIRNFVQTELHEIAMNAWEINGTQEKAAKELGISKGVFGQFRRDDGTSFGPSLRETVLYYCGLSAAAGIRPMEGFECLTAEDYRMLNAMADYMDSVSGKGPFKGEYTEAVTA